MSEEVFCRAVDEMCDAINGRVTGSEYGSYEGKGDYGIKVAGSVALPLGLGAELVGWVMLYKHGWRRGVGWYVRPKDDWEIRCDITLRVADNDLGLWGSPGFAGAYDRSNETWNVRWKTY